MKSHGPLVTWIAICLLSLFVSPVSAIGQEQSEKNGHSWLNGRWEGQHSGGGKLEMELQVKVKEIIGEGIIRQTRDPARQTITGSVEGKKITLDVFFLQQQATTRYQCRATEDKALECSTKTKTGPFKSTFTKVR